MSLQSDLAQGLNGTLFLHLHRDLGGITTSVDQSARLKDSWIIGIITPVVALYLDKIKYDVFWLWSVYIETKLH